MSIFRTFRNLLLLTTLIAFVGCSSVRKIEKEVVEQGESEHFFKGFVVYDPVARKELINVNGNKYFTPASNTKLFTFYSAYKTFKDSVVGLEVYETADSLIVSGTADPAFLYGFENEGIFPFLAAQDKNIYILDRNIEENPLGFGWAHDDYAYSYMVEKNLFPIYGNYVRFSKKGSTVVAAPRIFETFLEVNDSRSERRASSENIFYAKSGDNFEQREIPFRTSNQLVADILSDTLQKKVTLIPDQQDLPLKPVYSVPYDTLFTRMMKVSDNFIAEQLMLQVGHALTGHYSVAKGIDTVLKSYLKDLPQKPRWVDGSGLSRYNLFTPSSLVFLLEKMYREIPREKLLAYFPAGGSSGTLKNFFKMDPPYVYAKTGTLSNNYCLSGYLITKKGKMLIFSYMNNHYMGSSNDRKKEMEEVFLQLYHHY